MRKLCFLFRVGWGGVIGLCLTLVLIAAALLAPLVAPADPNALGVEGTYAPPSLAHPFGRDSFGRDTLSRVLYGSRISLVIGFVSVLIGATAGSLLGVVAAYRGGRIDRVILRATDVMLSFPTLILGLLVVVALGPDVTNATIAVAVTLVPKFVRYARGPGIAVSRREFVQGAIAAGAGNLRVIFRHILPSVISPVAVMAAIWVGIAIRIEASLSFLGVGVPPPTPAWGSMMREGVEAMLFTPWLALFPGLAIMVTILAMNLLGDWLRDVLDPHMVSMFREADSPGEGAERAPVRVSSYSSGDEIARLG